MLDYSVRVVDLGNYKNLRSDMSKRSGEIKAKYSVWQASLFGACAIALGIGVLLATYVSDTFAWLLIAIGVVVHGLGMYQMYKNK